MDHRPVQICERPPRPLAIGDIVVTSEGRRCRVVALTPQDHGDGFTTVHVGLVPLTDDEPGPARAGPPRDT